MPEAPTPPAHSHAFRFGGSIDLVLTGFFSLVFIAFVALGAAWLSVRSNSVLTEEVRGDLQTSAALAAMQFSPSDIAAVIVTKTQRTAAFRALVDRAERIRQAIPNVEYLYVMRRTDDPNTLAFVIENDMLYSPVRQDRNGDGTIETDEQVPSPGDTFDASNIPAMRDDAFVRPASDSAVTFDKWGVWMSAYAPIRDADGKTVAILGIDVRSDQFVQMTKSILSPELLLLIILAVTFVAASFLILFWSRRMRLLRRIDAQRIGMVTIASHKLGGPIATIRWWVESLADGSADKALTQETRTELANAVERLSDVTRHLEDATRVDGTDPQLWKELADETSREIPGAR